jgi:hypothetical protein
MKHLTISEISLLSETEKKARKITFDKARTVVLGNNETGKSSLVKSIYHALGAEPAKQHQRWLNAEVKSLLRFTVEDQEFSLIRDGNLFSLFAGTGRFLDSFTSVTKGLGPYLSQIFDFNLILPSRDEGAQTPPPAFLYLPYYIDQDASWQNAWSGFSRLQQFAGWKSSVAEYHTGIRDNYFYELQAKALDLAKELGAADQKIAGLLNVLKTLDQDTRATLFDLNPASFEEKLGRLLNESDSLLARENEIKSELSQLNSQRALHKTRLDIATRALGEISGDFKFLSELATEEIGCPTCGTEYNNDFAVRFAIATDEDRVATFISQIRGEIARLDARISEVYAKFRLSHNQSAGIQRILAEKQNEVTLEMIIESEGRKSARGLLRTQLDSAHDERNSLATAHSEATDRLKDHRMKLSTTEEGILAEYRELLRRNLNELEVNPLSADAYDAIAPQIRETGSTLPRALLAYYFAILELASKRSPATVCPIVIDSPNQQAQDDHSLAVMLKFIAERQPTGTQLILSVEKTMDVDLGGKLIELNDKYHLLSQAEYARVKAEISELLKAAAKA